MERNGKAQTDTKTVVHSLRVVASFALVGAAVAGAFLGWAPIAVGALGVHEIGALVGAAIGVLANARHLV